MEASLKPIENQIIFHLCDTNEDIVNNFRTYFGDYDNFNIYEDDVIKVYKTLRLKYEDSNIAIVSPANSFGDMQGGIDLVYYNYFGHEIEETVQDKIIRDKYGELVIGDSIMVNIPNHKHTFLIVSPTMKIPSNIENTVNVYLAFRSTLITCVENKYIEHIIVPGLGS
jgi:O-acetyl-ADP-ribose deacetylase (regulator of RNase III)